MENPTSTAKPLSKREVEIMRLIAEGMSTKQLADKLFIAPYTVSNHRKAILRKTGCKNVAELTRYCLTSGLLQMQ